MNKLFNIFRKRQRSCNFIARLNRREVERLTRSDDGSLDGLLHLITSQPNLLAAWNRVSGNDGAETPGDDGHRCSDMTISY